MPRPQILTYVDAGASDWTACLMRTIGHQLHASTYEIRAVMADDIRHDATLFDGAVLFVMPGGADLPYCAMLNGAPNARIRHFVEQGGAYLGICAGAYYACRELAFHAGTRGAICGPRELCFVDAVAVGSLPELTDGMLYDGTPRTTAAVKLRTTDSLTDAPMSLYTHYHGGCRFDFGDTPGPDTQVLAVYADIDGTPPAIVSSRVGKGRAVLAGVHLEISERECKDALRGHSDMPEHLHVCDRLAETGDTRLAVFRRLLAHAGLALN
ncbi:biotin--protein ligase [Cupriavidus sp. SK-4]|uniref:BPL-N domain-containing protein n=1 Tax=Cupriavidus sp. SK-4 TaxID=574750 RepID=UPI000448762B|nr:BPL-N domain-containing protein [Cupriavidus sp. SK-4]EYS94033.1 biotin--protein ligase [Cupriavidus sp. SK-4]